MVPTYVGHEKLHHVAVSQGRRQSNGRGALLVLRVDECGCGCVLRVVVRAAGEEYVGVPVAVWWGPHVERHRQ